MAQEDNTNVGSKGQENIKLDCTQLLPTFSYRNEIFLVLLTLMYHTSCNFCMQIINICYFYMAKPKLSEFKDFKKKLTALSNQLWRALYLLFIIWWWRKLAKGKVSIRLAASSQNLKHSRENKLLLNIYFQVTLSYRKTEEKKSLRQNWGRGKKTT